MEKNYIVVLVRYKNEYMTFKLTQFCRIALS